MGKYYTNIYELVDLGDVVGCLFDEDYSDEIGDDYEVEFKSNNAWFDIEEASFIYEKQGDRLVATGEVMVGDTIVDINDLYALHKEDRYRDLTAVATWTEYYNETPDYYDRASEQWYPGSCDSSEEEFPLYSDEIIESWAGRMEAYYMAHRDIAFSEHNLEVRELSRIEMMIFKKYHPEEHDLEDK